MEQRNAQCTLYAESDLKIIRVQFLYNCTQKKQNKFACDWTNGLIKDGRYNRLSPLNGRAHMKSQIQTIQRRC